MKYTQTISKLFIGILLLTFLSCAHTPKRPVEELTYRLIPQFADRFIFEEKVASDSLDFYEIESKGPKIIIRGNNDNSMAVGLNRYLKDFCLTTITWDIADSIYMPDNLPSVPSIVRGKARCQNRFFLNYCTFGYTMPWWKWDDWERFIDWMALNGINLPLAITGQEAVWYHVWKKMGLTDEEIRNYFTGPAHLPWHRMSNLDYWQGPLPLSWLKNQENLQKQIVKRERELNMKPVLPAFAGHVPQELNRVFPKAKISRLSEWGGFPDRYRSHFLDPMDSLFSVIQKEFLTEQTKMFGSDHIYGADPFNELVPPSWEPEYLSSVSRTIYESMSQVDPQAIWIQMTWLFYIDMPSWTKERVNAFVNAVPKGKMILLDYYAENKEVWRITDRYFGQPYIWCYLGNFGGNTMLAGNMKETGMRIENVFHEGGDNFTGIGSTLEGFDVNPLMYEYVFDKAWDISIPDESWIEKLADRRTGKIDPHARNAWKLLYDSIYTQPAQLGQGALTNARPSFKGHGNWTTQPYINYDNKTLLKAWGEMLQATPRNNDLYSFDVVNIGRQVLGNYFSVLRDRFTKAYIHKDKNELSRIGQQMINLLTDIDELLSTHSAFSFERWINKARQTGITDEESDYFEQNARTLLTTWGEKNQSLNDYANRTWAGLVQNYYRVRWKMFIDDAISALNEGKEFDEKALFRKVTDFELSFTQQTGYSEVQSKRNSVETAKKMYQKYASQIAE